MHANQEILLKRRSIRDLPNEILLTVFSYLPTHDVKYCVANVCLEWSALARDKTLWRNLDFKTTNKSTKTFGVASWFSTLRFLETTPEVQNVIVSPGHSDEELAELLKALDEHCPNLRRLDFDFDAAALVEPLKGRKRLVEKVESLKLTLVDVWFSHEDVFRTLSKFRKLKEITLRGTNPETLGFRVFLQNAPLVQHLDLAAVVFSEANFMTLWKHKEKLVSLAMKIDKLDGECLELLGLFPNLESLKLADGHCSPEKLGWIGKLECLVGLHLQETASAPVLTASAVTDFFRNGNLDRLKELKLQKSRLDDEGAAEIRKKCRNLLYLEVMTYPRSLSSLSEKALVHFLHCRSLRRFEIIFDNSQEKDWIYRRTRLLPHDCDADKECPLGLEELLKSWEEIQIPVD